MNKPNKVINLYLIISLLGIVLFFLIVPFKHDIMKWLVMEHNFKYTFSDYFRQIIYSTNLSQVYLITNDTPFPPFAYIMFHLLWKLNPIKYNSITYASLVLCRNNSINLIIFFVILIITILALYIVINKILKESPLFKNILLVTSLILSAPFLGGTIERGNPILLVLVLLLLAVYLKDSPNKVCQELALILIAIAAAFKIYPALLALLYVKERRFKEFLRLGIYCIGLLFIPYLFTGGYKGMINHFAILGGFEKYQLWNYRFTSIRCFYYAIMSGFGFHYNNFFLVSGVILENLFIAISIFLFYKTTDKWKSLLYLFGIMAVYVSNSFRYTAIYMVVPLCFLIKNILNGKHQVNKHTYVYIILFALIYTIPIYGVMLEVDFLIFVPIYLILLFSFYEDFKLIKKNKIST